LPAPVQSVADALGAGLALVITGCGVRSAGRTRTA